MHFSVYYLILNAILINPFECYHHHHHRRKVHRRQSQQMPQAPQQMPQKYYFLQQPISQPPIDYPVYPPSPASNRLPIGNSQFPYGNPYVPPAAPFGNVAQLPGNIAVPYNDVGLLRGHDGMSGNAPVIPADVASLTNRGPLLLGKEPTILENAAATGKMDDLSLSPDSAIPFSFSSTPVDDIQPTLTDFGTSIASYPPLMPSYSNPNPANVGSRRRRKNIGDNNDALMKFFEKGKKLLEVSTVNDLLSDSAILKDDNHATENDHVENNATLIPLAKGIQLKSDTKNDESIIHAAVNISSSTQKIVTFDNNTEIENVVEMQMEKKIEDEKGADKGFEEVRIVERERVKPMVKWNTLKVQRRKRKSHKNRFMAHHRSKRSKTAVDDVLKSKSLYNKMARRFLSAVKRKERVVEPSGLMNRYLIPLFPEPNLKPSTEDTKQTRDDSMYGRKEINDFMKFFLNEMKKFRKFRENKNNISGPLVKSCKECKSLKLLPNETRKIKENLPYPEHMNVIMNLTMSWDSEKKYVDKSAMLLKAYRTSDPGLGNTTASSREFANQLTTSFPVYMNKSQSARFLTAVLFFSAMTCLFTLSSLILPKLYKLIRLNRVNSATKSYKLYDDYPRNRFKEIENKNLLSEDNQQLEWQSENGDWLSEKESDFK